MDQAYKDIARKLCLPGWNDPNIDTFQLVSEWLSNEAHGSWLLVLDSADDTEVFFSTKSKPSSVGSEQTAPLINYLPRSLNGSTLITTRDKRVGERLTNREKTIMVLPMTESEAEILLWSKVAREDKTKSSELLKALEYLPLAITQAAAFIGENNITVEEYLEAFYADDSEMQDLLYEDLPDLRRDFESQNSVIRTWKVSFDQIRKQKPRAAEILSLMAFLDRQGIPKTLLRRDGERGIEFTTALGTLQAFSLIATEKGGANFEIHRLVQVSTQRWLELRNETAKWQKEALTVLAAAFPSGDYGTWGTCEALSPHAQAVTRFIFTSDVNLLQRAKLLHNMSSYDGTQGRYNLAYERGLDALSTREDVLGPEHPNTLMSINNLAGVLYDQGKYETAEKMHLRTLELREKTLGPEHHDTLASMGNLALVLVYQGKYDAAEEMQRKVLSLREKVLGLEHRDTLTSVNNLARLLENQGKYEAAEEMQRRALELYEGGLGPEHPDTLVSMNNLALVLWSQGKYEAAEEMQRQVLNLRDKVLGHEHPSTLTSMSNLALALYDQGKYKEAEEMIRRALELSEKVLGCEHPHTLAKMSSLAGMLSSSGKYEAAEEIQRRALNLREKVLGPVHPDTLQSMNNLAAALWDQGKYESAEELQRRAVELCEKVLGPEHPHTLTMISNHATLLGDQGKYEVAEEMQRRALELTEKVLGPEHPSTLMSLNNLAMVLHEQGKHESAEEMGLRALKLNEKVLGPEHPQTLASRNNLAVMLDIQGKNEASEASEASESSVEMQLQELELELRRIIAGVDVSESRPMERGRTAGRASDGDEQEGA
jgi:tetratricopeptide (TPR) repeat protein